MPAEREANRGAPHIRDLGSRSEATRAAILDAALALFARVGFEASSTRDIAKAAGVHHASLRYHFAGKEELWRAAIRNMFDRQRELFRAEQVQRPLSLDTTEGLKEALRRYVRYSAAHPEHAQILVHEAIADTARLDWAVDAFVRANAGAFEAPLAREAAAGNLRIADPRMAAIILSGATQMVFVLSGHLRRVWGTDTRSPEFIDRFCDSLMQLFFER
jgi:AcrR family transcriptional regulator